MSVDPLQLKEVQKLIDSDEVILEFFVTGAKTVVFIVEKKNARAIKVDITEEELKKKVQNLRESLTKQGYLKDSNAYKPLAKELYELLLKPALPSGKIKRLCIVPHGVLHYLPFHMLTDGKEYLIDKYEIFYSPSASVQQFCLQKRKQSKEHILALGNPDFAKALPQLPFAEAEIKKIQDLYEEKASKWFWEQFDKMAMADERREEILKLKSLVDAVVRLSYNAFSTSGGLGIVIK